MATYRLTRKGFERTTPTKREQIAKLQQEQDGLREQLEQQAADFAERLSQMAQGQEVALTMIEFLLPALAKEIGTQASEPQVEGRTKVANVGNVHVVIDGFARQALLTANGNTTHVVAPLTLVFGTDGKLNPQQMRNFRGFLAEVATPVQASPFWDGSEAIAA